MGRANPIAVVYKLTNVANGKVYIGETFSFYTRMSQYRSTPKRDAKYNSAPIYQAILKYGFDMFTVEILKSEYDDPNIKDVWYRRNLEAKYINRYHSTDPRFGYNVMDETPVYARRKDREGPKHTTYTKILKSEAILAYNREDGNVFMYLGAESCAKQLKISDRSMIIRSTKTGKALHGYAFFKVNLEKREEDIRRILADKVKIKKNAAENGKSNGKSEKALAKYIKAARAVNDYCEIAGFGTIDIDAILQEYGL